MQGSHRAVSRRVQESSSNHAAPLTPTWKADPAARKKPDNSSTSCSSIKANGVREPDTGSVPGTTATGRRRAVAVIDHGLPLAMVRVSSSESAAACGAVEPSDFGPVGIRCCLVVPHRSHMAPYSP